MGKRSKENAALVDADKLYELTEALAIVEQQKAAKFDESVDVSIKLGVDPKKSDQMVRGSVTLPHGLGKTVRVLVFAKGDKAEEAKAAGADFVGDDDLIAKIQGGWLGFDKAIATPDMMASVSKVGKVLGPRSLMPNPKVGTVTTDLTKAVTESKAGRVEFRVEKAGIIHASVGRKSFGADKLKDNFNALLEAVLRAKPASAKGQYVRGLSVSTTMGPGLTLDAVKVINN